MYVSEVDSVGQWLQDLRCMTETECMCVLQGKSLSKDTTDVVFTTSKTTKGSFCTYLLTWNHQNVILFIFTNIVPFILDHIDLIKARAQIISTEFAKLFRWVSWGSSASLVPGGTNRGPTAAAQSVFQIALPLYAFRNAHETREYFIYTITVIMFIW